MGPLTPTPSSAPRRLPRRWTQCPSWMNEAETRRRPVRQHDPDRHDLARRSAGRHPDTVSTRTMPPTPYTTQGWKASGAASATRKTSARDEIERAIREINAAIHKFASRSAPEPGSTASGVPAGLLQRRLSMRCDESSCHEPPHTAGRQPEEDKRPPGFRGRIDQPGLQQLEHGAETHHSLVRIVQLLRVATPTASMLAADS